MIDRSDEETGEIVKAWIRRHAPPILLGIVIALGVLYLIDWYKHRQRQQNHQLSYQLETLQKALNADQANDIKVAYSSDLQNDTNEAGYLAALMMAGYYARQGEISAAEKALDKAMGAKDVLVVQSAQWQRANLQANTKQYDEALKTLSSLESSAYRVQALNLKGDILYIQNHLQDALTTYEAVQKLSPSPMMALRISQLKAAQLTTKESQ